MSDGPDDVFWCIEKIRDAGSAREISAQLLRMSDGIVNQYGAQLQLECVARQFRAGATFLQLRERALHAVRDAHGILPASIALELEAWRETLSRFASGHSSELPGFMTEAQRAANGQ